MNFLLDTHLLLWTAGAPDRLSGEARELIADPANTLFFSTASLWEIAIKQGLGRDDFRVDARRLWRLLLANGYRELAVAGEHAVLVVNLPAIHKDPFDRMLLAQAATEGLVLLTADEMLMRYGGPVRRV